MQMEEYFVPLGYFVFFFLHKQYQLISFMIKK